jgi:hypothetical protein
MTEFLAQHRVPWPSPAEHVPQRLFHRKISITDRRLVRLGLHPQVQRAEAAHRNVVRGVREDMRESKVAIKTCHPGKR